MNAWIALDQLAWVLLTLGKGRPDETISAAAWRMEVQGKPGGRVLRPVLDALFRRFRWQGRYAPEQVVVFDCPFAITEDELREEMLSDIDALCDGGGSLWQRLARTLYGWRDYLMFAARPLFHALGRSTPNYGGRVCSGRIRDMGAARGWTELGTAQDPEPSPCDWARWLKQAEGVTWGSPA